MTKVVIGFCLLFAVAVAAIPIYFQLTHNSAPTVVTSEPPISQIFNATVSKTRLGAFNTVMDAILAAPVYSPTRYYIHVEAGVYQEVVEVWENKTNIALIGDGEVNTKISWNRRSPEFTTFYTATVAVYGHGFIAKYLTFENTAGEGSQAVAMMSMSQHSAFYKCTFLGYQDTLYAKDLFQFYRECTIYGTVDFIFGAAKAVFQSCNIYSRISKSVSTLTAQQAQRAQHEDLGSGHSGFVIQNCTLTVVPGTEQQKSSVKAYLGRPWSNYSTVVVMESYLDDIIQPKGWLEWEGRITTNLTYIEYNNRGPGSSTSGRVSWEGFKSVTQPDEVEKYTVGVFISGDEWIPTTGIPYSSGFMMRS